MTAIESRPIRFATIVRCARRTARMTPLGGWTPQTVARAWVRHHAGHGVFRDLTEAEGAVLARLIEWTIVENLADG